MALIDCPGSGSEISYKYQYWLAVAAFCSSSAIACGVGNVTLDKLRGETKYDMLYVYGTIKHNCEEAVGVQLKLTVYNKKDEIVDVQTQWPASIRNIPPGVPYSFKATAEAAGGGGKFNIDVESVKRWRER